MKCTRKEFEDKIFKAFPNAIFYLDFCPDETLFVFDDPGLAAPTLTPNGRHALASHVWSDGEVIKDVTGLFSMYVVTRTYTTPQGGHYTLTLPNANSFNGSIVVKSNSSDPVWISAPDSVTEFAKPKCECGAHSVGSNHHSSWCQLGGHLDVVT